ncbi:MAG: hypothetical protein QF709_01855 [Candidatus Thalassarchaeum sp.]|nr:hypothetical protein [Candidatus Thalassarchaeum sp.]
MGRSSLALAMTLVMILHMSSPTLLGMEDGDRGSEARDSSLDILMLGNSYTSTNSLAVRLDSILTDSGEDAVVTSLTSGGLKLNEHAERADTPGHSWNASLQQQHDYVILQDQSQVPGLSTETEYWQESLQGLEYLNQRIESQGGDTILFMTWGRKEGDWLHPDFSSMQDSVSRGYEMYNENISTSDRPTYIAPVGLAFKHIHDAVEASGINATDDGTAFSTLYSSDGSHPSIDGTYLTACVFHSTITGESSVGSAAPSQIAPWRALELQQAAADTVFNETLDYTYPWQIERSNVRFGPESGSVFEIDPGASIGLNFNFTNHAEVDDTAMIAITGAQGWEITWQNPGSPQAGHLFEAPSDVAQWVQFSITAPSVSDGYPLAGSLHQFNMQLTSGSDGSRDWYNFSLRYGFYHGASIEVGGGNASLSPGEVIDLSVTARNLGNSVRDLVVGIAETDGNGTLAGEPGMSLSSDGWAAIVLNRVELDAMSPNESGQVHIQVQAPDRYPGSLFFDVLVWSSAAPEDVSTVSQSVSITPRTGGLLSMDSNGCEGDTQPGESCHVSLRVENTGDVTSSFLLTAVGAEGAGWLSVEVSQDMITLGPGQSMSGIGVSCTVSEGTFADLAASVDARIWLGGWSPDTVQFEVTVDERYEWLLERISSDLSEDNNLTSQWTLTNAGNEPDGLVVNLDVNMVTDFGLQPPPGSSTSTASGNPRSFEVMDVEPGDSVVFSAWMVVPSEAPVETTAVLTVEVRSIRDPDIVFTDRDTASVPATSVPAAEQGGGAGLQIAIDWLEAWHELILIAIVVIAGSIGVIVAMRIRKQRELALMEPEQSGEESAEEWMARFEEGGGQAPELVESPRIGARDFAAEFIEKSGGLPEKPRAGPGEEVVKTASDVIDKHQAKDDIESVTEIADRITEGEMPHPSNVMLDPAERETRRVVPRKSRDDDSPDDYDLEI